MAYPEDTEENENFFGGCDESVHEVQLAENEVQQGALVTNIENDGNYPNLACQNWNIMGDPNQVYVSSSLILLSVTKTYFISLY